MSKSIVGLLYGIALAQGKVPPPEAPLFAAFPEYADLAADAGRDRLTIHHVLTMTMGTDWDESSLPYSDPANSEIAMDLAPDRYRYILERRVVMEPGKRWTYCGGATALLARLIAKGTGKPLHDFRARSAVRSARARPDGMGAEAKGEPFAASGLRMTPRDLARIGMMMANGGMAGDRRVVPAQWLARCTAPIMPSTRFAATAISGTWRYRIRQAARLGAGRLERWWGALARAASGCSCCQS